MTSEEKAIELVEKFRISKAITESYSKQCALIAVDEIIKSNAMLPPNLNWLEVKKEIEAL
jgi:hypothetical protein